MIPKAALLKTITGRNLVDFYEEKILPRYCPDGCDPVILYNQWWDLFDVVNVWVYVDDLKITFKFLNAKGDVVDEHHEDIYDEEQAKAIIADLGRVAGAKA